MTQKGTLIKLSTNQGLITTFLKLLISSLTQNKKTWFWYKLSKNILLTGLKSENWFNLCLRWWKESGHSVICFTFYQKIYSEDNLKCTWNRRKNYVHIHYVGYYYIQRLVWLLLFINFFFSVLLYKYEWLIQTLSMRK